MTPCIRRSEIKVTKKYEGNDGQRKTRSYFDFNIGEVATMEVGSRFHSMQIHKEFNYSSVPNTLMFLYLLPYPDIYLKLEHLVHQTFLATSHSSIFMLLKFHYSSFHDYNQVNIYLTTHANNLWNKSNVDMKIRQPLDVIQIFCTQ